MPRAKISGFVPRANAQRDYSRSKSSFIRDVEDAFKRGDTDFLKSFCVSLNDGTVIDGPDATKERVRSLDSKQPRWFIETKLLETRYWETASDDEPSEQGSVAASQPHSKKAKYLPGASDVLQLQHKLALAEQKISDRDQKIGELKEDKTFLQTELENRRGEIDKLRDFFDSVGEAANSAAQLQSGAKDQRHKNIVDAEEGSGWFERNTPTFHWLGDKAWRFFFRRS